LKLYLGNRYDITIVPQILDNFYDNNDVSLNIYDSVVFKQFKYPSVIYCLNSGRETVAETDMWTKYVPMDIRTLIGLTLILFAILNTTIRPHKKPLKFILQNGVLFANSFLNLSGIILRQSWSHKWKLLAILELLLSTLISVYENSITVSVAVPLVPKPLSKTVELYNHNYTFVTQTESSGKVYGMLSDEYNTVNRRRVIAMNDFWHINQWLEWYFLKQNNDTKYAIVGFLSTNFHFRAVMYLKEKQDTCYLVYPAEKAFYPQAVYFVFISPIASSFQKGVSLLESVGFVRAFETVNDFRESMFALNESRALAHKHGYQGMTYKDIKNSRLKESMITLGNIKSVLHVGLMIIVSAGVAFLAEIYSTETYIMMLK